VKYGIIYDREEIVQLYIKYLVGIITRPVKEFKIKFLKKRSN